MCVCASFCPNGFRMNKIRDLFKQLRGWDFWAGGKELFWMSLFGLMPLWVGWISLRAHGTVPASTFLRNFFVDGDLLLVSAVLVGPLMYPLFKQYGDRDNPTAPFPLNWLFAAIILIIAILSTILFAIIKVSLAELDAAVSTQGLDDSFLFVVSFICGGVAFLTTFAINTLLISWNIGTFRRYLGVTRLKCWRSGSNEPAAVPSRSVVNQKTFKALRVTQPIGDIFIASLSAQLIQKISHFDVRRVLRDERDVEKYLGIQRPLSPRRVDELKRYVAYADAQFSHLDHYRD
jgi:hypothetical protein